MRWASIILSAACMWLDVSLAEPQLSRRTPPNVVGEFVWRSDARSPREIRGAGGFRPWGENWHRNEAAFVVARHYLAGPAGCGIERDVAARPFLTAFVSLARDREVSEQYRHGHQGGGTWLYEIRATPNMFDAQLADDEIVALGGVHWRQIRRYALMNVTEGTETYTWHYNPDYDRELYETSEHAGSCVVETEVPPGLDDYWDPDEMDAEDTTRDDTDASGSDEEEEEHGRERYPRLGSAVTHMSGSIMEALFGDFPPVFRRYEPRDDIPGPRGANAPVELVTSEQVWRELDFWATITPDQMRRAFPDYDEMLQDLLNQLDQSFCASGSSRQRLRARTNETPNNACCKKLSNIRRVVVMQQRKTKIRHKGFLSPVKILLYGDYLWPQEAKAMGGFLPPLESPLTPLYMSDGDAPDTQPLDVDWPTKALSMHLLFGDAAHSAALKAADETEGFHGIVYAVHATPNMVLNSKDAMAVGGIRWEQVLGWVQVPLNYTPPRTNKTERGDLKEHFVKALTEMKHSGLFQENKDYNHTFDRYSASKEALLLATPRPEQFLDKHGKAIGWRGKFPLFEPAQNITAHESHQAKTANRVAPAHEPDFWQRVGTFFKAHALAIALMPVVAVASVIPVVGEIADVAEVAALSEGAVEGMEVLEAAEEGYEVTPLLQGIKLKVE
ncbi:putative enterotoxin [Ophiocordyceps australis]|uniref:Putative enterotoxin n=1 Tax=Ophiocordyceps australis TaxID=1399860 RepID=A0A2C5XXT5_9HYPO|nr:putative enterotoxin [Ophiocordyceps australis]